MTTSYHDDNRRFQQFNEPYCIEGMGTRGAAQILTRDPQDSITTGLSRQQDKTLPDTSLIDYQPQIQWVMRPYLINFLIKAHAAFALLPETLFLTYGDTQDRTPRIHEPKEVCCGLYDAGMFTQMEMHVLNTLEWSIGHPTVDLFSQLIVAERGDDLEVKSMAAYISEIALYYRDFVSTKPSTMARCSLVLARLILGRSEAGSTNINEIEKDTLYNLLGYLSQPPETVQRKYSEPRLHRVSDTLAEIGHANKQTIAVPSPPVTPPIKQSTTGVTPKSVGFSA
ncbi:hypothetical protein EDB80DRAFT_693469 [Ilyonectria destructans]|nr:hypothetical protein EDB80DRAFT_693469 [Ilyonectria destructans]